MTSNPEARQQLPAHKPACDKRGTANEPKSHYERRSNHYQFEEEGGDANQAGSQRGGLDDVESFVPAWRKPPGMVEAQEAEDDVPNEEKSSEEGKVPDLHAHGEKVSQRDCGRLVCNK
jgi:hypothetical protein